MSGTAALALMSRSQVPVRTWKAGKDHPSQCLQEPLSRCLQVAEVDVWEVLPEAGQGECCDGLVRCTDSHYWSVKV
jgi:hypothetical protein